MLREEDSYSYLELAGTSKEQGLEVYIYGLEWMRSEHKM